MTIILNN